MINGEENKNNEINTWIDKQWIMFWVNKCIDKCKKNRGVSK